MRLSERTAVVTGAASGIGRATARRFAEDGASVLVADRDGEGAEAVAALLREDGFAARAAAVDVADEASVAAMVEAAIAWTGRIDTVAANAGIMVEGSILSVSVANWQRAMDVNSTGAFLTARHALPHLVKSAGTLVFTASTVALAGMKGIAAYAASKGAVAALARQLAADFAEHGVRVNAVAPGAVRTPLSESQFRARAKDDAEFEALLGQVIARYPLKRWCTPEEIAEVILFLATSRSAWITGQILPVDGGLLELR
ncbi:SDR family NAD(P)-dependent oxidoreductase [Acuticoccus kandeliae]|uniref:SDR family NAD(P)-dependent oxidoreductase n=1 Tax=Acuticoccus kandeliae TaxID=2073160 RepID=UPI001300978E|nr:SDR family oxidoreductase [Acuticoccus kandeliae]